MHTKSSPAKRPLFWFVAVLATLGVSIGMLAFSQQQVDLADDHALELATVVVGPSTSKNIGSNVHFAPLDQVKWVIYTGPPIRPYKADDINDITKVGYPESVDGVVALPSGFTVDAATFLGPPRTVIDTSADGQVSWRQVPSRTFIAADPTTAFTTDRATGNVNSVTVFYDMDFQDNFKCDPARDTLLGWKELRIDHRVTSFGLDKIVVAVFSPGSTPGTYIPLKDEGSPPKNTVFTVDFAETPDNVPTAVDISAIPKSVRKMRFQITFHINSRSLVTGSAMNALNAFDNKPVDVTWRGDQPQVCFTATAPAAVPKVDFTTKVDVKFSRGATQNAALSAGQRFDPDSTAYDGYGPTVLTAQIATTGAATKNVLLQSTYDMDRHIGNLLAYDVTSSSISPAPYASAASSLKLGGGLETIPNRPILTNTGKINSLEDTWNRLLFTWFWVSGEDRDAFVASEPPWARDLRRTFTYDTSPNQVGTYNRFYDENPTWSGGAAQRRLEYMRGSRSYEASPTPATVTSGTNFRKRNGVLGPVVNSSPVWVPQKPQVGYPETLFPGYAGFRKNADHDRDAPHVLFGGHDGMLHGFKLEASTLTEAFSYIPNFLLEKVHYYTNGTKAQLGLTPFAIDTTPMVRDVRLPTLPSTGSAPWRTAVVSSMGRKNRGIFALDITTRYSRNSTEPGFPFRGTFWEYTNESNVPSQTSDGKTISESQLRDLGQMVYQPPIDSVVGAEQIVRMNGGRWATVVGNGINSHRGPDPVRNGTGRAVLYLFFFVSNTPVIPTKEGSPNQLPWQRISVSETDPELAFNNGLLSPRPYDIDGDGNVDLIYAGDMKGNLWRFDVKDLDNVKVVRLFKSDSGKPILAAPVVRPYIDRTTSECDEARLCQIVSFGTGYPASPLTPGPLEVGDDHALYGLIDINSRSGSTTLLPPLFLRSPGQSKASDEHRIKESNLINHPLSLEPETTPADRTITVGATVATPRGWKLPLWKGEQMISNPLIFSDNSVLYTTGRYWPFKSTASTDNFAYRSKRSWLTQLDLVTGQPKRLLFNETGKRWTASLAINGPIYASPASLPTSPGASTNELVIQIGGVGKASGNSNMSNVTQGAGPAVLGRLSWREVVGE